ncbi:MAG: c-type cytochrome [Betaproteobacteria bacterium]|nr:c-type cytochrome [Betaproteobacteria bacterium]MDE2310307.1 c-type cytochrome [Betaproteobacteria bacterium]
METSMSTRYLVMLAAGLVFAGNALAESGEVLAKNSNCMTCHAVDNKLLGPPFREVAAKYKNDKGAQAALEKKVRSGGAGVWGKMPMPATAMSVSDGDIKGIVQWVLSLK